MSGKFGIVYHPLNNQAISLSHELAEALSRRGGDVWTSSAWESAKLKSLMSGSELVITAGGDGTILRTAQAIMPGNIPILGVNLGRLGFLTEIDTDEINDRLDDIISKNGWFDERATLEVDLLDRDVMEHFFALNDVVISRGAIARIIELTVKIDGRFLTTYRADGVIAATATGSTGYSLAAGGPVLYSSSSDILLTPIAPHLSLPYSLVLSEDSFVEIDVATNHQAVMNIDGFINRPLADGAAIRVRKGGAKAVFLRFKEVAFPASLVNRFFCRSNNVSGGKSQD